MCSNVRLMNMQCIRPVEYALETARNAFVRGVQQQQSVTR